MHSARKSRTTVVRLPRQRRCTHRRPGLEFVEPCDQPGPALSEIRQLAEFEPAQCGRYGNMADMDRRVLVEFAFEPVVARDQLLRIAVPQGCVTQRLRPA